MWSLRGIFIALLSFLVLLVLGIFIIVANSKISLTGIDIQNSTSVISNILTPLITLIAVWVYYVTLKQIQKQTQQQKEDSKLLQGEYFLKMYEEEIIKLEQALNKVNIGYEIHSMDKEIFKRGKFNLNLLNLSEYTHLIARLEYKFIHESSYLEILDKIDNWQEEIEKLEWHNFYKILNRFYDSLSIQIKKVMVLLYKVKSDDIIHKAHKKLLIEKIVRLLLSDYIVVFNSGLIENYKLYYYQDDGSVRRRFLISKYGEIEIGSKVLDYYKILDLLNWVKKESPLVFSELIHSQKFTKKMYNSINGK